MKLYYHGYICIDLFSQIEKLTCSAYDASMLYIYIYGQVFCLAEARCVLAWLCEEVIGFANQYRDDRWISLMATCTWGDW